MIAPEFPDVEMNHMANHPGWPVVDLFSIPVSSSTCHENKRGSMLSNALDVVEYENGGGVSTSNSRSHQSHQPMRGTSVTRPPGRTR